MSHTYNKTVPPAAICRDEEEEMAYVAGRQTEEGSVDNTDFEIIERPNCEGNETIQEPPVAGPSEQSPPSDTQEATTLTDEQKDDLNESIALVLSELDQKDREFLDLQDTLDLLSAQHSSAKAFSKTLREQRKELDQHRKGMEKHRKELENQRKAKERARKDIESERKQVENERRAEERTRNALSRQRIRDDNAIAAIDRAISAIDGRISAIDQRIHRQDGVIADQDAVINQWDGQISQHDRVTWNKDIEINNQDGVASNAERQLSDHKEVVRQHHDESKALKRKLARFRAELAGQTKQPPQVTHHLVDPFDSVRTFQDPDGSPVTVRFTYNSLNVESADSTFTVSGGGSVSNGGCAIFTSISGGDHRVVLTVDVDREKGAAYACGGRIEWTIDPAFSCIKTLDVTSRKNLQVNVKDDLTVEIRT